ncbi:Golgi-associated plant pathogenesis-related protein 1 [Exaiptasia diaphana]|uniref:ShKT domain-containing protein n=1 Tax=Exaiptasia diaphana TaxID=2652724 RepID=A0A913Y9P9_EXADI|nr:Golgi-associated plant pathogenesis-related protein 1 [Exaiptasia diaphana]
MILVLLLALVVVSSGLQDCNPEYQEDTQDCTYYKNQGDCTNKWAEWMKTNCKIACGYCQVASTTQPPTQSPSTSVPVTQTPSTQTPSNFDSACLQAHNAKRSVHSAPDLTWDSGLAATATSWAQHLASTGGFSHSTGNYGENIYYSWGTNEGTCEQAVQSWYDEIKDYDYQNPGFSSKTGHFTQVVWKSSTKLGVGKATADDGGGYKKTYIVAQYTPAGNSGAYAANVLPKNA